MNGGFDDFPFPDNNNNPNSFLPDRNEPNNFNPSNISIQQDRNESNDNNLFFLINMINQPFSFNQNNPMDLYREEYNQNNEAETHSNMNNNNNMSTQYRTLFEIRPVSKTRLGRKPKNSSNNNGKKIHDKYEKKNMMFVYKRNIYNNSLEAVNELLKQSDNNKINKIQLLKNDTSKVVKNKKTDNEALLSLKVKDMLSFKITSRFKYNDKDYNKKQIEFILEQDDEEINEFLNKDFEDLINIYKETNDKTGVFRYFKRVDDDIKKYAQDKKYIKYYRAMSNNFKGIIKEMQSRKRD